VFELSSNVAPEKAVDREKRVKGYFEEVMDR